MPIDSIDLSRTLFLERYYSSRIFDAIPKDQGDFRPQPGMRSITEQLCHLGAYDEWLVLGVKDKNWDFEVFNDRPEQNVEEALAYMDYNRKRLIKLVEGIPNEVLHNPIGPNPGFSHQMGLGNVILYAATHECHHRGQLVVYLRMMNIVPPSLFGTD